tara:strand:+ start:112 stop:534 length:423 start_codon:yes stop_codon:yes gene_type:complete
MASPSKSSKKIYNKSIFKRLSNYFFIFSKNKVLDNNFNISAEMKSYRIQAQQRLLDSHYVNAELFETVMEAFDDIELEVFEAEPDTELMDDENAPDMIKDGEFTLIFSKKKPAKNVKTKSSKNRKTTEDIRQQPLPNIAG